MNRTTDPITGVAGVYAAHDACQKQAETSSQLRGSGSAGLSTRLHEKLWRRRSILQQEIAEVNLALEALNEDSTVQKVIRLLEVAEK